ncbi:leucine-rich repeat protein, partial [Tanacetum coccineum]
WTHHGESCDVSDDSDDDDVSFNDEEAGSDNMNGDNDDDDADDDLDEMLDNIGQGTWGDKWKTSAESSSSIDKDLESLRRLLDDSHQELYTGCQSYSKFSFIVTMLHLKITNGWSNKSFNDTLNVFKKALPSPSSVPKNFYEAKKYIRDLGFRGEKIHACVNDCVLYGGKYKSLTECPNKKCKEPRFKKRTLMYQQKVLPGTFPLKSRLHKVFIHPQVSNDRGGLKDVRVNDDNVVHISADSEVETFCREPLIDELNDLWGGINAYDAHIKENFTLRAALLWTINDFTAYGMLSGWSVKGYNACPICMNETSSSYLSHSRNVCYMGHRRFLPSSHQWRNDKKNFDGTRETRKPIVPMSGLEVLHDIDCTISEPCYSVKK